MEIKSIADLDQILETLQGEESTTRFFRGHSDSNFQLTPSIYREAYLIENEDKIIKDAILNCPSSFPNNTTLFDKLVTLQHYGYKTRLLDITMNALVALFFAVNDNDGADGELIVFDIPTSEIKYDSSDRVAILSALSLRDKTFSISKYIETASAMGDVAIMQYIVKEHQNLEVDRAYEAINSLEEDPVSKVSKEVIKQGIMNNIKDAREKGFKKSFNEQIDIVKIIHDIRNDKGNFDPIINYKDFNQVLCVRAKLDNQRIVRQQGSFLIFGMQETSKLEQANINPKWIRQKIIVPKEYKSKILNSLKSFGISKQTLFPELESQSKDIIEQYKPKI